LPAPRAVGRVFYRSIDNGETWTLVNNGLTSTDIASLAIKENGYIFAGTRSQFGVGGGVFRSTDNGETWTAQPNGFTAIDLNSLAINSAGDIFAGALGGAFRSTDDGESWSDISSGLVPTGGNVWSVAIDTTGYALAGTAGGGVFRSLQSTTSNVCPQPRRYWKDNSDLWPVSSLILGSQSYKKIELKKILEAKGGNGDASLVLAGQLIIAKLNLANGSDPTPVSSTIDDADALLSGFTERLPYKVKHSTPTGEAMANDVAVLLDYNLGNLSPGCGP
jgi:hypothetical protein